MTNEKVPCSCPKGPMYDEHSPYGFGDCYEKGFTFTCTCCGRTVPYCFGGADDETDAELCDDCWDAKHD